MANRSFNTHLELLEPRALLSHLNLVGMPAAVAKGKGQSPALVGTIAGTETPTSQGWQLAATGGVQPARRSHRGRLSRLWACRSKDRRRRGRQRDVDVFK